MLQSDAEAAKTKADRLAAAAARSNAKIRKKAII